MRVSDLIVLKSDQYFIFISSQYTANSKLLLEKETHRSFISLILANFLVPFFSENNYNLIKSLEIQLP